MEDFPRSKAMYKLCLTLLSFLSATHLPRFCTVLERTIEVILRVVDFYMDFEATPSLTPMLIRQMQLVKCIPDY